MEFGLQHHSLVMNFCHAQNMITGTKTSKTSQVASNWRANNFYMYQSRMSLALGSSRKSIQRARHPVFVVIWLFLRQINPHARFF